MTDPTHTKKRYETPSLSVLGNVREVTQSKSGPQVRADNGNEQQRNKTA